MKSLKNVGFRVLLVIMMLVAVYSPITPASASVIYTENFDDGQAQGWVLPSVASVTGQHLAFSTWSGEYVAVYDTTAYLGDYTFRVDVSPPDTGSNWNASRLIFNYTDANNYYYLHMGNAASGNQVELYKKVAGTATKIATGGSYPIGGQTTTIEVAYEVGGTITINATRNGATTTLFNQVQDTSLPSGKIGVGTRASDVSFENVTVTGAAGSGGGGGTPPTGSFNVVGSTIYDPNGQPFIIKGTNVNGPRWPWLRDTLQDVHLIADIWDFNTVRINMYPRMAYWNITNNMDLDAIVDAFTAKQVVSILEDHDLTGKYPESQGTYDPDGSYYPSLNELKQYWIDLANQYMDNPYVWFNPLNEPGPGTYTKPGSLAKWKSVHEELVQAIRSTGATNIIVLDGHNWGQEGGYKNGTSDSAILTHGPYLVQNYDNIVFSLHMYYEWTDGQSRLEDYLDDGASAGLPIHIGEYGAFDTGTTSAAAAMFNATVPRNVGRIVWHWAGGDDFKLTTGAGGYAIDRTDGIKPGNLTWMGDKIWDDNHGTLTLPITVTFSPIVNGGFESGLDPWANWAGASIVNSPVHGGSAALKVESGAAGGAGQTAFLNPNTTYKFSAWGRNSAAPGQSTDVGVKYKVGSVWTQPMIQFTETAWTYKEVTFTTPASFTDKQIFIWKNDSAVDFYIDDIQLVVQ